MHSAIKYYVEENPQERFHSKTAGKVRKEAMAGNINDYPIAPNPRIEKYWAEIKSKQKTNSN